MGYRTLGRHERLGPYVIEEKLGDGGMASVYLAYAPSGEQVALKVADGLDRTRRARLFAEYETLSRLDHPSIVKVSDLGEEGSYVYYAMEYIDGPSLKLFVLGDQVVYAVALRLFRQVLEATAYLHGRSVTHQDLKPTNILVRRSDGCAVLIDFGISRSPASPDLTAPGGFSGTLEYVSPEHARFLLGPTRGRRYEPTERDDVYALGVVLYYLLTGQWPVPRHGDSPEGQLSFLRRLQHFTPSHPRELTPHAPEAISHLALRMLQPRAELRPATARELLPAFLDAMREDEDALLSPLPIVRVADVTVMQARNALAPPTASAEPATILAPALADDSGDTAPADPRPDVDEASAPPDPAGSSVEPTRIVALSLLSAALSALLVLTLAVPGLPLWQHPFEAGESALGTLYGAPPLPGAAPLLEALPLINGPVSPYQQLPPCPRPTVAIRGACWLPFAVVGDEKDTRANCARAIEGYVLSLEDCLLNRRLFRAVTQPAPPSGRIR